MTGPTVRPPLGRRGLIAAAGAVIVLAAASTVTLAAAGGAFDSHGNGVPGRGCAPPPLPGTTVSIKLLDMRAAMTGGGMMGGSGGMMGQGDWRHFRHGMMRVRVPRTSVPAGTVSLRVTNTGYLTHELVVLPLAAGHGVGTRTVDADGTVDEAGSLGEASATCAAGEGEGIVGGSTGWVTLHLPSGRYELVCNLPGHYSAGMYAELDVA